MTSKNISEAISDISSRHIEEAADFQVKRKMSAWKKWGAMAACLGIILAGAALTIPHKTAGTASSVLTWTSDFQAEDYFRNCKAVDGVSSEDSIAEMPYAQERSFSDQREAMEQQGVIPMLPDHPLFDCVAGYNGDGSLFSVTFSWSQRGEKYSDLRITVGHQEVKQIRDCFVVELDRDGNPVAPTKTVTERDGVQIVAEGNENRDKTMTFQTDTAWVQISGSWNDSYASMAELLDWVWTHPVDMDLFTMDKGAKITYSTLAECPEAFSNEIPDFAALGFVLGDNVLRLKDEEPIDFEGHYYKGVDAALVESGEYLQAEGWTEIHWCVDAAPDEYDLQESCGDLAALSQQQVQDSLASEGKIAFMLHDCFIKIYSADADAVWAALASLTG